MSLIQSSQLRWPRSLVSPARVVLTIGMLALGRSASAVDGPAEIRGATADAAAPRNSIKKPAGFPSAPSKVIRYAERLIEKYDLNHDGVLQKDEWMSLHGHPEYIDTNRDGIISLDELSNWVADYGRRKRIGVPIEAEPALEPVATTAPVATSVPPKTADANALPTDESSAGAATTPGTPPPLANGERRRDSKFFVPSNRLPAGLPEWFVAKDLDGDGQLTVGEYSPTSNSQELADFAKLDANGDGLMTAKECVGRPAAKSAKKSADSTSEGGANEANPAQTRPSRGRKKAAATP